MHFTPVRGVTSVRGVTQIKRTMLTMMDPFTPDELVEDGEQFFYRDGNWTNKIGLCVPVTRSQQMTMDFYNAHGRMPVVEPKPKPKPRANSKAAKAAEAKADAIRIAIAKSIAAKAKIS